MIDRRLSVAIDPSDTVNPKTTPRPIGSAGQPIRMIAFSSGGFDTAIVALKQDGTVPDS